MVELYLFCDFPTGRLVLNHSGSLFLPAPVFFSRSDDRLLEHEPGPIPSSPMVGKRVAIKAPGRVSKLIVLIGPYGAVQYNP